MHNLNQSSAQNAIVSLKNEGIYLHVHWDNQQRNQENISNESVMCDPIVRQYFHLVPKLTLSTFIGLTPPPLVT